MRVPEAVPEPVADAGRGDRDQGPVPGHAAAGGRQRKGRVYYRGRSGHLQGVLCWTMLTSTARATAGAAEPVSYREGRPGVMVIETN